LSDHRGSREGAPLAETHLEAVQRILKEAIQPGEVDVIPAPNEFNQAIGRTAALSTLFRNRSYCIFKIIGQNVIEFGMAWLDCCGSHR
jgi:hypothetical protein